MIILESLREQAGVGGPGAGLANELLVIRDHYEQGLYTADEYLFLVSEIRDIRAQQELATDEIACRMIVSAAEMLMAAV